jgi:segregation and condensation protein B
LSPKEIKEIIKEDYADFAGVENLLKDLQAEYETLNKPYEIKYVAGGWTFATKPAFSPWIKKLLKEKNVLKLSPSALETLAMVAYKQPITRAEIDELRGVESSGVIDTLIERKLIKIVGRKEALGRPLLYGTTQDFLKHFGLAHLSELPLIEDMPKESQQTENAPEPELPFADERSAKEWSDMNFVNSSADARPQRQNSEHDGNAGSAALTEQVPPDENASGGESSDGQSSAGQPASQLPAEQLPAEQTHAEHVSGQQLSSEVRPSPVSEVQNESENETNAGKSLLEERASPQQASAEQNSAEVMPDIIQESRSEFAVETETTKAETAKVETAEVESAKAETEEKGI